jgi:predicted phosphodiesterase
MSVYVIGDTHGYWGSLNTFINKKQPSIILHCGDFGYWPHFHNTTALQSTHYDEYERLISMNLKRKKWDQYGIKSKYTKIYFCDGNHEDHDSLKILRESCKKKRVPIKIMDNVYYMPRGTIIKLPDGRNILFMGGADSIDKLARTEHVDWFRQEIISEADLINLPDENIDVVISHTCPKEIYDQVSMFSKFKNVDPSSAALSYILDKYSPKEWYFGHFHTFKSGIVKNTKWTCLNQESDSGWYKDITLKGD